jgi:hypothetical protein
MIIGNFERCGTLSSFEPETVMDVMQVRIGICHIGTPRFLKVTTANFKAHMMDRLFALFIPDEKDKKFQVLITLTCSCLFIHHLEFTIFFGSLLQPARMQGKAPKITSSIVT